MTSCPRLPPQRKSKCTFILALMQVQAHLRAMDLRTLNSHCDIRTPGLDTVRASNVARSGRGGRTATGLGGGIRPGSGAEFGRRQPTESAADFVSCGGAAVALACAAVRIMRRCERTWKNR